LLLTYGRGAVERRTVVCSSGLFINSEHCFNAFWLLGSTSSLSQVRRSQLEVYARGESFESMCVVVDSEIFDKKLCAEVYAEEIGHIIYNNISRARGGQGDRGYETLTKPVTKYIHIYNRTSDARVQENILLLKFLPHSPACTYTFLHALALQMY